MLLSPFDIVYSQEARVYTLLSLSATLYGATCFYYLNALITSARRLDISGLAWALLYLTGPSIGLRLG